MTLTQTVTELLCTSSPQQRLTTLSISLPSAGGNTHPPPRGASYNKESGVRALSKEGTVRGAYEAPTSHFFTGSAAPSFADVGPATATFSSLRGGPARAMGHFFQKYWRENRPREVFIYPTPWELQAFSESTEAS